MLDHVRLHQTSWAESEAAEKAANKAYFVRAETICSALATKLKPKPCASTYKRILHAKLTLNRLNGNVSLRRPDEKHVCGLSDKDAARAFFNRHFPGIFRIRSPHARRSYINLMLWKARKPNRRRDTMRMLNASYRLQNYHKRLPWVLSHAQFEELLSCFRHTDDLYNANRELYTRVMGQQPRRPDAPARLANRLCKVVTLSCIFKRFAELLGYHAFASMIPTTQNESSRRRHLKFWHLTCRLLGIPFHVHSFHEHTHPDYQ